MRCNLLQMRCNLNQWASTHVDNLWVRNIWHNHPRPMGHPRSSTRWLHSAHHWSAPKKSRALRAPRLAFVHLASQSELGEFGTWRHYNSPVFQSSWLRNSLFLDTIRSRRKLGANWTFWMFHGNIVVLLLLFYFSLHTQNIPWYLFLAF